MVRLLLPQRNVRALARRRRTRRGVALIMVLSTLTILSFMLSEFQDMMSAELQSSLTTRDQVKAEYAAKSAVSLARLLLASEPTIRRDLVPLMMMLGEQPKQIPVWNFSDAVLGAFNDQDGTEAFQNLSGLNAKAGRNLGLSGAGFYLKIIDEDSKINFNMAARADTFSQQRTAEQILALIGGMQYNEYFDKADENGDLNTRQIVCGAIIDWVDPNSDLNACDPRNQNASQSGAEDSYYQLLPRPDQRKNAGFDSLEELRLVRGISDDFWTTFIQPDPDRPESRNVTVWGTGQVNVNTANPQTLMSLACMLAKPDTPLCMDPVQQMQFIQTLQILAGFSGGMPLFSSAKDFVNTIQGKGKAAAFLKMMIPDFKPIAQLSESELLKVLSTESRVFSIYATGYVRAGKFETKKAIHAVVDMRGAPPPGGAADLAIYSRLQDSGQTEFSPDKPQDNPFLLPSPGGSLIYFRVD